MPNYARFFSESCSPFQANYSIMDSERNRRYVISKRVDGFFNIFSDISAFVGRFFKELFHRPYNWNEIINHGF